jgi:hypothetical protein
MGMGPMILIAILREKYSRHPASVIDNTLNYYFVSRNNMGNDRR